MLGAVGAAAMRGAVGGVGVVAGQTIARKVRGGLQGVVTTKANVSTGLPGLATTAGAALALSAVHAMMTPSKYRSFGEAVVLGAWAEAINFGLALTPVAPYLSAFPPRPALRVIDPRRFGGYARRGLGAPAFGTSTTFGAYTRAMGVPTNAGMGGAGY